MMSAEHCATSSNMTWKSFPLTRCKGVLGQSRKRARQLIGAFANGSVQQGETSTKVEPCGNGSMQQEKSSTRAETCSDKSMEQEELSNAVETCGFKQKGSNKKLVLTVNNKDQARVNVLAW